MADDETQIDESPDDLSVYDLAEKVAAGQRLSDQAHREIAGELVRLNAAITELYNDESGYFCETPQQEAQALLDRRTAIERLLNP